MTLIAVFNPDKPVIFSDVLLSHKGEPQVSFVPTGRLVQPIDDADSYQPHSFAQKTLLLRDDTVAFAGSGDVNKLRFIATDLRDEIRKGMSQGELLAWAARRTRICGKDTGAIVSWAEGGHVETLTTGAGIETIMLPQGGSALCGGTGAQWLRRTAIKESQVLDSVGEFSAYEMVLNLAIAQTAQHLAQERFLGVRQAFGGGFQVTWFDGARFRSTPQVVYLLFLVEHAADGEVMTLAGPPVVQRSDSGKLSTELWIPEHESFHISDGVAVLRTRSRFLETTVPTLIHTSRQPIAAVNLSIGEYVGIYTVHVRDGKLIGLGNFQLTGDPRLTGVEFTGQRDGEMIIRIPEELFETWKTQFEPVTVLQPKKTANTE